MEVQFHFIGMFGTREEDRFCLACGCKIDRLRYGHGPTPVAPSPCVSTLEISFVTLATGMYLLILQGVQFCML